LFATFEGCTPAAFEQACTVMSVADEELPYLSGIRFLSSLNSVNTATVRCDTTFSKRLNGTAWVDVTCPTGGGSNGSLSLKVRTVAIGTGAFSQYELAAITGLSDVLAEVNYALTLTASSDEPCVLTGQPIVRFEPN